MAETIQEIVGAVRMRCGTPRHDKLRNAQILAALGDQLDHLNNLLNLTEQNFQVLRKILPVQSNVAEIPINADNFGRAIMLETHDSSDSEFVPREVQLVDYQDFELFRRDIPNVTAGQRHTIRIAGFFKENDIWKMAVYPQQEDTKDYRLWYEPAYYTLGKFAESPQFLRQFYNLLKVSTARSVVGLCGWAEQEYLQIRDALDYDYARFSEAFDRYIHQNTEDDSGPRRAFNSSREGWYY